MAKRPAVRRGRKNPNTSAKKVAVRHSVEPALVVPTSQKESLEADLQLFPMSGAVDRTAELEARLKLDKQLNAILGTDEEEGLEEQKAPAHQQPKVQEQHKSKRKRSYIKQEKAQNKITKDQESGGMEYSETGSVLFDAVLPDSHKGIKTELPKASDSQSALRDERRTESRRHESADAGSVAVGETEIPVPSNEKPASVGADVSTDSLQIASDNQDHRASVSIYDYQQDKATQEARIQAEVDRRVSAARAEMEPQVIVSPRAVRRGRMTILFVSLGIVALALISIILGINYDRMNKNLKEASQELDFYKSLMNGEDTWTPEQTDVAGSSGAEGEQVKKDDGTRRVYLTFDDGPSEVTVETLDILATYGVKATFFVNGKEDERSSYIYNRIVDEGHTLAMHGYTHEFDQIYSSLDSFSEDMSKLRNLLYDRTGGRVWGKYYRFPGGSSTTTAKTDIKELASYLNREGVTYYDWNVYGGDDIDAATMLSNIQASVTKYNEAMILLHDAADKKATVEALPGIIEYLQGLEDTVLLPITDDTVPIQHGGQ